MKKIISFIIVSMCFLCLSCQSANKNTKTLDDYNNFIDKTLFLSGVELNDKTYKDLYEIEYVYYLRFGFATSTIYCVYDKNDISKIIELFDANDINFKKCDNEQEKLMDPFIKIHIKNTDIDLDFTVINKKLQFVNNNHECFSSLGEITNYDEIESIISKHPGAIKNRRYQSLRFFFTH